MNRSFQAEDAMCAKATYTAAGGVRVAIGRGQRAESTPAAGARPQEFLKAGREYCGARLGVESGEPVREDRSSLKETTPGPGPKAQQPPAETSLGLPSRRSQKNL